MTKAKALSPSEKCFWCLFEKHLSNVGLFWDISKDPAYNIANLKLQKLSTRQRGELRYWLSRIKNVSSLANCYPCGQPHSLLLRQFRQQLPPDVVTAIADLKNKIEAATSRLQFLKSQLKTRLELAQSTTELLKLISHTRAAITRYRNHKQQIELANAAFLRKLQVANDTGTEEKKKGASV